MVYDGGEETKGEGHPAVIPHFHKPYSMEIRQPGREVNMSYLPLVQSYEFPTEIRK
jgi:hypothetical protein